MLPHFAQEGINVTLNPLGPYAGVSDKGIAGATRIAFGFRVEHLVGHITDLFAQALQAITEPTTKPAAFLRSQQQAQRKPGDAPKEHAPGHRAGHPTKRVFFHAFGVWVA